MSDFPKEMLFDVARWPLAFGLEGFAIDRWLRLGIARGRFSQARLRLWHDYRRPLTGDGPDLWETSCQMSPAGEADNSRNTRHVTVRLLPRGQVGPQLSFQRSIGIRDVAHLSDYEGSVAFGVRQRCS